MIGRGVLYIYSVPIPMEPVHSSFYQLFTLASKELLTLGIDENISTNFVSALTALKAKS